MFCLCARVLIWCCRFESLLGQRVPNSTGCSRIQRFEWQLVLTWCCRFGYSSNHSKFWAYCLTGRKVFAPQSAWQIGEGAPNCLKDWRGCAPECLTDWRGCDPSCLTGWRGCTPSCLIDWRRRAPSCLIDWSGCAPKCITDSSGRVPGCFIDWSGRSPEDCGIDSKTY